MVSPRGLTVNDGFNQARAQSMRFSADGSPPTPRIVSPNARQTLNAGIVRLSGSAHDDRQRPLRGSALTWFAGSKRLGTGQRLNIRLPGGPLTLRLRARDSRGRTATTVERLRIKPAALRVRALRVPDTVRTAARRVAVRIATTIPATLRAGARSFRVGPQARTVRIPLPVRPKAGLLKIRLTLKALGPPQPTLRQTIVIVRG